MFYYLTIHFILTFLLSVKMVLKSRRLHFVLKKSVLLRIFCTYFFVHMLQCFLGYILSRVMLESYTNSFPRLFLSMCLPICSIEELMLLYIPINFWLLRFFPGVYKMVSALVTLASLVLLGTFELILSSAWNVLPSDIPMVYSFTSCRPLFGCQISVRPSLAISLKIWHASPPFPIPLHCFISLQSPCYHCLFLLEPKLHKGRDFVCLVHCCIPGVHSSACI